MVISSNTLFHFTNTAENLLGILRNNFFPRFCLEEFEVFSKENLNLYDLAIPMVCFCDLPLSNMKEHLQNYGNYGLGMDKSWGIRQGLSPILYLNPSSDFHTHLHKVCDLVLESNIGNYEVLAEVMELYSFIKPPKGKSFRNGKYIEKNFYDEREWRFVPTNEGDIEEFRLAKKNFLDNVKRAEANRNLETKTQLIFEPNDIRYIIVSDESEITSMIRAVRDTKKHRFDSEETDLLSSRIISATQIREDF